MKMMLLPKHRLLFVVSVLHLLSRLGVTDAWSSSWTVGTTNVSRRRTPNTSHLTTADVKSLMSENLIQRRQVSSLLRTDSTPSLLLAHPTVIWSGRRYCRAILYHIFFPLFLSDAVAIYSILLLFSLDRYSIYYLSSCRFIFGFDAP